MMAPNRRYELSTEFRTPSGFLQRGPVRADLRTLGPGRLCNESRRQRHPGSDQFRQ